MFNRGVHGLQTKIQRDKNMIRVKTKRQNGQDKKMKRVKAPPLPFCLDPFCLFLTWPFLSFHLFIFLSLHFVFFQLDPFCFDPFHHDPLHLDPFQFHLELHLGGSTPTKVPSHLFPWPLTHDPFCLSIFLYFCLFNCLSLSSFCLFFSWPFLTPLSWGDLPHKNPLLKGHCPSGVAFTPLS